MALATAAAGADPDVENRLKRSAEALRNFRANAPEPARQLLDRAVCVGVIPKRVQGEPESDGHGFVSCQMPGSAQHAWSSPAAFIIENGLVWPFEGAEKDFIFVAVDRGSAARLSGAEVFIGFDLQARPGPVMTGSPALPINYPVIYSWVQKGAEISGVQISGANITADQDANQAMYGQRMQTAAVLKRPDNQQSPAATEFLAELPSAGQAQNQAGLFSPASSRQFQR